MAASTRAQLITFTGDVVGTELVSAASNPTSPAQIQILTLSSGFNSISVPTGGSTPTALTILPPVGNLITLTLKGITGDTGILLHLTDPTTIALASSVTSIGLTTSGILTGLRLYWS